MHTFDSHAPVRPADSATAIVATLLYCTLPLLTRPIANMVPIEWEKKIGVTVVDSIPGANRYCHDGSGQESLAKLTRSLSRVMDLPYPVTVTIARMDLKNAFAAPGGFIVIGKELIAEMESPDEFAGVLAHEMAHIAERHPISRLIHVFGIGILFELIVGGDAAVVEALLEGTSLLLFLSHSRDDEREAQF
ncbi:M48 family metallopeptidase [uncultured Microbacterium sp.]|uniref:M48 family metallopeptidase n=1 Tax=uncultured Microbacterium sp. TaxID=191216 RepID=UPI0025911078|nr:M48 family metallopeptidase [uncultured Microbacterium sp.]